MARTFGLVVLATFAFVFSNAYCEESSKGEKDYSHFRGTRFGMTVAQVKQIEESKPVEETKETLVYKDKIMGLQVDVFYMFVNNQLFRGAYFITEKYRNENNHIDNYKQLKKVLVKKYKKPVFDAENWRNPLYKNKRHKHGFAVSIGHLEYKSEWLKYIKGRKVWINTVLKGENYKITHFIVYTDVLLEKFYNEQQEQKEKSKL